MRLKDEVTIVTGDGSEIGRARCLAFAREGACGFVVDVKEDKARAVAEEMADRQGEAQAIDRDVSNPQHVGQMVAQVLEAFGVVDILVNNAGIHVRSHVAGIAIAV